MPLHHASENGHLNVIQYLIEIQHCDPSCTDENKKNPLNYAILNGNSTTVHFLKKAMLSHIQEFSNERCEELCEENAEKLKDTEQNDRLSELEAIIAEYKQKLDFYEKKFPLERETEQRYKDILAECKEREERYQERAVEYEQRLRLYEEQLSRQETQWVVRREEIQFTGPELGRGGWATVSVALFRGTHVAAKVIHHQILSQHNRQLFKREMNMAARIRHPNLLQFIGATLEGEMVILTELMPTSLRKELEKESQHLSMTVLTSICMDVARALNYLHLMRPDPIIHRDISSANVLLEPLPNSCWRAKVADYGSINLLHKVQTTVPGNPTYAAPEASKDPQQQSPKMDIFSFGVLIIEMLTGVLPPPEERFRLMSSIKHPLFLSLVRRCLKQKIQDRPTASDIIAEFNPHV